MLDSRLGKSAAKEDMVTMTELRKMFDGSEKLVGILVNPSRVRQKFLP